MANVIHLNRYVGWRRKLTDQQRDEHRWVVLCSQEQEQDSILLFPSRKDGFDNFGPYKCLVCETCVMLHFANPEGTEHLED